MEGAEFGLMLKALPVDIGSISIEFFFDFVGEPLNLRGPPRSLSRGRSEQDSNAQERVLSSGCVAQQSSLKGGVIEITWLRRGSLNLAHCSFYMLQLLARYDMPTARIRIIVIFAARNLVIQKVRHLHRRSLPPMTENDVYLTRHGSRIDKEDFNWLRKAGHDRRDDPHLSTAGEEQAVQLATRLVEIHAARPLQHIVCSPFVRCLQTAKPVACALGLSIKVEPGICEILSVFPPGLLDAAVLQQEFPQIDVSYVPCVQRSQLSAEGSDGQAARRAADTARAVRAHLEGPILFVGHGASCLGIAEAFGGHDYIGYASLTHFVQDSKRKWSVSGAFGDVSHLSSEHQRVSLASAF